MPAPQTHFLHTGHQLTHLQTVQGLMQKLLLQLIAELQRLGAVVVYADTGSLILNTGKRNLTAAVG